MKKLLFIALLLGVTGAQAANPNFDIWNKTTTPPLYYAVGTDKNMPSPVGMTELKGSGEEAGTVKGRLQAAATFFGKKVTGKTDDSDTYSQKTIDTSGKVLILLSRKKNLAVGDKATLVTINANGKDVIVRIKPDNAGKALFAGDSAKYLFGPQTGVGKGFKIPEAISKKLGGKVPAGRISERGLSLENNITDADITVNPDYTI